MIQITIDKDTNTITISGDGLMAFDLFTRDGKDGTKADPLHFECNLFDLNPAGVEYILEYGIRQSLADSAADPKKDRNSAVTDRWEAIKTGTLSTKTGWTPTPEDAAILAVLSLTDPKVIKANQRDQKIAIANAKGDSATMVMVNAVLGAMKTKK